MSQAKDSQLPRSGCEHQIRGRESSGKAYEYKHNCRCNYEVFDTITEVGKAKPLLILRDARITLASDVVDVTIKARKSELFRIVKQIAELSSTLNEPIHLFQLSNSIKLIADEMEYNSSIRSSLRQHPDCKGNSLIVKIGYSPFSCR